MLIDTLRTSLIRGASLVLAFVASVIYARTLSPDGYGVFAYVVSFAGLLAIPASLGIPGYLLRELGRQQASSHQLMRWGDSRLCVTGVFASLLMMTMAAVPQSGQARLLFLVAAPLPLITNLLASRQSRIQAAGFAAKSLWPTQILAPCVVLFAIVLVILAGNQPTALLLCALTVFGSLLAFVVMQIQTKGLDSRKKKTSVVQPRLGSAVGFMWLGMLFVINSRLDLLMLGAFRGATDTGVYAVASRAAELTSFFLIASNTVLAPRISNLHSQGKMRHLQHLISITSKRVFVATLPLSAILALFATPLLAHIYGPAYTMAAIPLQILVAGQIVSVFIGPTATLLTMTGHTKQTLMGLAISACANAILNVLLIPQFGPIGAAIATTISIVLWNALLWNFAYRLTGISTSAFSMASLKA